MEEMMAGASFAAFVDLLGSTLRLSLPLIFAALGGFLSERSGVINICLEGKMLVGAFVAASLAVSIPSAAAPWLGLVGGMAAGALVGLLYAVWVIHWRADQIVAGTAINLLALGMIPVVSKALFGSTGSTPTIPLDQRFGGEPLLLAGVATLLIWIFLHKTRAGLVLQAAGEKPEALAPAGFRVASVRTWAVCGAGALAAAGGAVLSLYLSSGYTRGMSAGRGFMALAALIVGKWYPVQAVAACLAFGFADALQIRLQGRPLWQGGGEIPSQFVQMLPFLATIIILAGWVGTSRAPAALGKRE